MAKAIDNTGKLSARTAILLGIGAGLGVLVLLDSVVFSGNLEAFWAVLHGRQLHPVEDSSISTGEAISELAGIAIALIALACVAGTGQRAAGLTWGSAPRQARLLGEWMLVIGIAMTATTIVVVQLVAMSGGKGVGNDNLNIDAVPAWFLVLKFINAGFVEEIVVVAIAWRLMELISTRSGKPAFVMTGAATVILVLLRVSYHLYQGFPILFIVAIGWLTVRFYRHTRSLGTLIVAHILWNIVGQLVTTPIPTEVLFVAAGGLLAWILTTGPAPFGPHFGFAFGRERENPTGHLPYRFIWQTPKTISLPPSSSASPEPPAPKLTSQDGND